MIDRLDSLQASLVAALPRDVALTRDSVGGVDRLKATRSLDDGSARYLMITWVGSPDSPRGLDVFAILGGSYRNADPSKDTDGRQWGSAAHTQQIVVRWLVELRDDWTSLPLSE